MAVKIIIIICLFDRWFYSSLWPFSGFCLLEDKNDLCSKFHVKLLILNWEFLDSCKDKTHFMLLSSRVQKMRSHITGEINYYKFST